MQDIRINIVAAAQMNSAFRREAITGAHGQVVLMSIPPGGEIGEEVHPETDQVFIVVEGVGEAWLDHQPTPLHASDLLFVRAGTRHNVVSIGPRWLRLVTIYAPPQHSPGTVHQTKQVAEAAEHSM